MGASSSCLGTGSLTKQDIRELLNKPQNDKPQNRKTVERWYHAAGKEIALTAAAFVMAGGSALYALSELLVRGPTKEVAIILTLTIACGAACSIAKCSARKKLHALAARRITRALMRQNTMG
jgi:hypothetical protein